MPIERNRLSLPRKCCSYCILGILSLLCSRSLSFLLINCNHVWFGLFCILRFSSERISSFFIFFWSKNHPHNRYFCCYSIQFGSSICYFPFIFFFDLISTVVSWLTLQLLLFFFVYLNWLFFVHWVLVSKRHCCDREKDDV